MGTRNRKRKERKIKVVLVFQRSPFLSSSSSSSSPLSALSLLLLLPIQLLIMNNSSNLESLSSNMKPENSPVRAVNILGRLRLAIEQMQKVRSTLTKRGK